MLTVANTNTGTGAKINTDTNSANQQWTFTSNGEGTYTIKPVNSSNVFEISGGGTTNGTGVEIWSSNSGANQKWKLYDLGDGTYKLIDSHSNDALYVAGSRTADGTAVQIWADRILWGQKWQLIPAENTAPLAPFSLTTTAVSDTQINLCWTSSTDNVGVTGYNIYRNGTLMGTSTMTSPAIQPVRLHLDVLRAHKALYQNTVHFCSLSLFNI